MILNIVKQDGCQFLISNHHGEAILKINDDFVNVTRGMIQVPVDCSVELYHPVENVKGYRNKESSTEEFPSYLTPGEYANRLFALERQKGKIPDYEFAYNVQKHKAMYAPHTVTEYVKKSDVVIVNSILVTNEDIKDEPWITMIHQLSGNQESLQRFVYKQEPNVHILLDRLYSVHKLNITQTTSSYVGRTGAIEFRIIHGRLLLNIDNTYNVQMDLPTINAVADLSTIREASAQLEEFLTAHVNKYVYLRDKKKVTDVLGIIKELEKIYDKLREVEVYKKHESNVKYILNSIYSLKELAANTIESEGQTDE